MSDRTVTRTNQKDFGELVRQRKPFVASALSGSPGEGSYGALPRGLRDLYWADTPAYTIHSYATPIAWLPGRGGPWVVPKVKYSPTTSKHQTFVRRALAGDYVEV